MVVLIAALLLAPLSIKHGERSRDPAVCRISMDYSEVPLETILRDLERTTGIPIEIHPELRENMDLGRLKVSIKLRDCPLLSAVSLLLRSHFFTLSVVPIDDQKILVWSNH